MPASVMKPISAATDSGWPGQPQADYAANQGSGTLAMIRPASAPSGSGCRDDENQRRQAERQHGDQPGRLLLRLELAAQVMKYPRAAEIRPPPGAGRRRRRTAPALHVGRDDDAPPPLVAGDLVRAVGILDAGQPGQQGCARSASRSAGWPNPPAKAPSRASGRRDQTAVAFDDLRHHLAIDQVCRLRQLRRRDAVAGGGVEIDLHLDLRRQHLFSISRSASPGIFASRSRSQPGLRPQGIEILAPTMRMAICARTPDSMWSMRWAMAGRC